MKSWKGRISLPFQASQPVLTTHRWREEETFLRAALPGWLPCISHWPELGSYPLPNQPLMRGWHYSQANQSPPTPKWGVVAASPEAHAFMGHKGGHDQNCNFVKKKLEGSDAGQAAQCPQPGFLAPGRVYCFLNHSPPHLPWPLYLFSKMSGFPIFFSGKLIFILHDCISFLMLL